MREMPIPAQSNTPARLHHCFLRRVDRGRPGMHRARSGPSFCCHSTASKHLLSARWRRGCLGVQAHRRRPAVGCASPLAADLPPPLSLIHTHCQKLPCNENVTMRGLPRSKSAVCSAIQALGKCATFAKKAMLLYTALGVAARQEFSDARILQYPTPRRFRQNC